MRTPLPFLLLSLLASAVLAEEPNARTVTETYQDWQLVCSERNKATQCEARQQVMNQNQQTVALLTLAIVPEKKQLLQIALPHLLDLTKQVAIVIDEQKPRPYPFRFCNPTACFLIVEAGDPLFDQLKKGSAGVIKVTPMGQAEVGFKFSLKGFSAALASLEKR